MPAYLISGPAGSGKSLISRQLTVRGYHTIDMDSDPRLSGYYDCQTGRKVPRETVNPVTWHEGHLWNWDKERMQELFDENAQRVVFFCGTAHNEAEFFTWFSSRFALFADTETIVRRLQEREPEVWADGSLRLNDLIAWNGQFREYCRQSGMLSIDASQSPQKIADDILAAIDNPIPYYNAIKSFVDDEVFPCAKPLKAVHISEQCTLLHDRDELVRRLPRRAKVAEVGTRAGNFAKHILMTSDPQELHLFDLSFTQEQFRFDHEFFRPYMSQETVFLHEGDSFLKLGTFPDEYFDWIYINGDHSLQGIRRDISQAKRKMRDDGFLAFHDYAAYSPLEKIQYGVQVAVNDLLIEEGFEIIYLALDNLGYHDICLRRKRPIQQVRVS